MSPSMVLSLHQTLHKISDPKSSWQRPWMLDLCFSVQTWPQGAVSIHLYPCSRFLGHSLFRPSPKSFLISPTCVSSRCLVIFPNKAPCYFFSLHVDMLMVLIPWRRHYFLFSPSTTAGGVLSSVSGVHFTISIVPNSLSMSMYGNKRKIGAFIHMVMILKFCTIYNPFSFHGVKRKICLFFIQRSCICLGITHSEFTYDFGFN